MVSQPVEASRAVPSAALSPIEFHFDFSSPYSYLGSELIESFAARHGRQVNWHPMLLGAAFKTTGMAPLVQVPLKGNYSVRDFARSARFHGIPFSLPARFPLPTQHAARAFLWFAQDDEAQARSFAHAVFRAYFMAGRDIDQVDTVLDIAAAFGVARAELAEALQGTALKDALKQEVDRALARGVFGAPWFIVDDEAFWGVDRLPQLERWLVEGGF